MVSGLRALGDCVLGMGWSYTNPTSLSPKYYGSVGTKKVGRESGSPSFKEKSRGKRVWFQDYFLSRNAIRHPNQMGAFLSPTNSVRTG